MARTRSRRRLRAQRFSRGWQWRTTDLASVRLTKRRLKAALFDHVFAIYVLRIHFDGDPMTKIGIVRAGSLRQRLTTHLSKAHYTNVHVLRIFTLSASSASGRYQCDGIVNTTETNIKRALSRKGMLPPTPWGPNGECETEVVRRCDEGDALRWIEHFTSSDATLRAAAKHRLW